MIRKNCTSSVKLAFLHAQGQYKVKNIHTTKLLKYKGIKQLSGEKVVAIIRNPYERTISFWQNKLCDQADNGRQRTKWLQMGFKMRCTFEEYLEQLEKVVMLDGHTKPQANHLPLNVDYMLDMDEMSEQWKLLQKQHGWLPELKKRNFTRYKETFDKFLTPENKERIEKIYQKDITLYRGMKLRSQGDLHDVRILKETLSGERAGQMKVEIDSLINLYKEKEVTSYLEIGARYGDTFYEMMRNLPEGSKGVCVDLPGHVWGTPGTEKALYKACKKLRAMGYEITMILGDSTEPGIIEQVKNLGPFDGALIDGDHRYAGVKTDYENYKHFINQHGYIAFHDIVGAGQRHRIGIEVEVPKFWEEVKKDLYSKEFIGPGSSMGIGVIWNI